jgi:hypothetical protein
VWRAIGSFFVSTSLNERIERRRCQGWLRRRFWDTRQNVVNEIFTHNYCMLNLFCRFWSRCRGWLRRGLSCRYGTRKELALIARVPTRKASIGALSRVIGAKLQKAGWPRRRFLSRCGGWLRRRFWRRCRGWLRGRRTRREHALIARVASIGAHFHGANLYKADSWPQRRFWSRCGGWLRRRFWRRCRGWLRRRLRCADVPVSFITFVANTTVASFGII